MNKLINKICKKLSVSVFYKKCIQEIILDSLYKMKTQPKETEFKVCSTGWRPPGVISSHLKLQYTDLLNN